MIDSGTNKVAGGQAFVNWLAQGRRFPNQSIWSLILAAALLILLAFQVMGGAAASSATFDELYQLSAGYAYLRTGDARLSNHHPPLIDVWVAIPLLMFNLHLPLDSAAWQQAERGSFGDVFVWQANADQALRLLWVARLPNVALALLLGAALFRWTSKLSGRAAGFLALAPYVLDPGIIANASLSTNDLGVAAMLFFATWAWWAWLERPSILHLILAGVMAGFACTSKYSGLAIGPIVLLLALAHRPAGGWRKVVWLRAGGLTGVAALCALTIWAVYGFSIQNGLPAPSFWKGVFFQSDRLAYGQPVYALSQVWPNGVWFYYPLAFLLKTPLPTLILATAAVIVVIKKRAFRVALPLALPIVVFSAATLASALQLGYRYLLPILPFMFALAGQVATAIPCPLRRRNVVPASIAGLLLIWLAIDAATIYPHHLSFFNELAGGPENGDRYLVDSNLDWGQDLPALKALMEERDLPFVHLGYFGTAIPGVYGIHYWPTPGFLRFVGDAESMAFNPYTPDPGWYAISRTSLRQGLVLTHPDLYAYFRSLSPEDRAGYSIDLYHVEYAPSTLIVRAVVQGSRVADVPVEQLGWQEGQRLIAKWVPDGDSFVFAMHGPARYLVPDPLPYAPDLRDAVLQHGQRDEQGMLEFNARDAAAPLLEQWSAGSEIWTPERESLEAPVSFDGRIELLGYRLERASVSPGEDVSLTLAWQVSGELRPPIASFVHLIDAEGQPIAQRDGWGSAISGLEVGDVIVQHVRIPVPPDAAPGRYRLQLGIYSRDTLARWPVQTPDGATIDRIWLPEVEIR
jgi:hypothetical protein